MLTRTILVIDDDPDVRSAVADALEMGGYRVRAASNGLEALHLLRDGGVRPDLILLDMMMPMMDGWEFRAEQLKLPGSAAVPIVVFTAYGLPRNAVPSLQPACSLKKPLRLHELLEVVRRLTEASSSP